LAQEAPGVSVPAGELEPELLAGELAAAERRLAYAQALAPLGLHVWGDSGWQQVPGLVYHGSAEHGVTINKIYSNAAINIDIGRLYQLDIVTMRVFDVLACGGFVLAEHSEDLAELFAIGEEVESWRTLDELLDKCRWYLANPAQRNQIAQRGYRAVCERHTIQQRLRMMLSTLT
jgi:spore maturation protein CgeB